MFYRHFFRGVARIVAACTVTIVLSACLNLKPASKLFPPFSQKPVTPLTWQCIKQTAEWQGREELAVQVFKGKVFMMGGYCGPAETDVRNDVWTSTKGDDWTQVCAHAPWAARYGHVAAVFAGKLWIMGGMSGYRWNYEKFNESALKKPL